MNGCCKYGLRAHGYKPNYFYDDNKQNLSVRFKAHRPEKKCRSSSKIKSIKRSKHNQQTCSCEQHQKLSNKKNHSQHVFSSTEHNCVCTQDSCTSRDSQKYAGKKNQTYTPKKNSYNKKSCLDKCMQTSGLFNKHETPKNCCNQYSKKHSNKNMKPIKKSSISKVIDCQKKDISLTRPNPDDLSKIPHRHLACFLPNNDPVYGAIKTSKNDSYKKFMCRREQLRQKVNEKKAKKNLMHANMCTCTCQRQTSGSEKNCCTGPGKTCKQDFTEKETTDDKLKKCLELLTKQIFEKIIITSKQKYKDHEYTKNLCDLHSKWNALDYCMQPPGNCMRKCPVCNINRRFYDSPNDCTPLPGWKPRKTWRTLSPLQSSMNFF